MENKVCSIFWAYNWYYHEFSLQVYSLHFIVIVANL